MFREIARPDGVKLAYELVPGRAPVVVFLPGFASDMTGLKASLLRESCAARGQAFLRLDYSGHGASGGDFMAGCIGVWAEDAKAVVEAACGGLELLLVGSSMGGWIALKLARDWGVLVRGIALVAPAPDFTADLIEPNLQAAQREALEAEGFFYPPSEYGPPAPLTRTLLEDGRRHLLLRGPIPVACPVRILHGIRDAAVPWRRSLTLVECLESEDVRLIFVKDGDHRLSRKQDLRLLTGTLAGLLGEDGA